MAGNVGGWERVMRTFRDDGYVLEYSPAKRAYRFPFKEPQNAAKDDRYINKKTRAMVLTRDNSTCQMCGKTVKEDGIKLYICEYQSPRAIRSLSPANCFANGSPALVQPCERRNPLKRPSFEVA